MFYYSLKVGFFLAIREIKKSSILANGLIIMVMMLTFLNLMVGRGVLIGLPEGATNSFKTQYAGDLIITKLDERKNILREKTILDAIKSDNEIQIYSTRYILIANFNADYKKTQTGTLEIDQTSAELVGIDFDKEDSVTELSKYIVKGKYFDDPYQKGVIVGSSLLGKYTSVEGVGNQTLNTPDVGDKIEITVNGKSEVLPIIGVLKTKVSQVDRRVYIPNKVLRTLIPSTDYKIGEIAIKIKPQFSVDSLKNRLEPFGRYAFIRTAEKAQPQFLSDIKVTFSILGDLIGTIGIIVASITLFIVIFVNAITKRRYIGILKGIGITNIAIEISYVIQATFYSVVGSILGLVILYGYIVPYSIANPISFPFSDGVIAADLKDTLVRTIILVTSAIIAGYLPARMIVKQNTLDSILGR